MIFATQNEQRSHCAALEGHPPPHRSRKVQQDTNTNKRSYFGARVILSAVGGNPGKNPSAYLWYLLTVVFARGIDPVGRGKNPGQTPNLLHRVALGAGGTPGYIPCAAPRLGCLTLLLKYYLSAKRTNWQHCSTLCRESERRSRRRECERWCSATKTDKRVGTRANEDLRRRLCAFIQAGNHSPETRARLAALEAQRPKTMEPPAESGEPRSGGHSRRASESDLGDAQAREASRPRSGAMAVPVIRVNRDIEAGGAGVEVFQGYRNSLEKPVADLSTEVRPPRVVAEQMRRGSDKIPPTTRGEGFNDYLIDIRALMHHAGYSVTQVLHRAYENASPEYKLYVTSARFLNLKPTDGNGRGIRECEGTEGGVHREITESQSRT
ncbi:hypothetical protein ACLKA6_005763 [Drosophila palustris]